MSDTDPDPDDLQTIPGIGDTIAENLRAAGFESADDVLEADVDELTQADRVGESTAEAILNGETEGYNGRPSLLDEHHDDIMDAAREGLTWQGIARVAGVGARTLRDWRDQYPEFEAEVKRQRAIGERKLVQNADPEFILERSYKYTKEQEIELSGGEEIGGLSSDDKEMLDEMFDRDPQE